MRSWQTILCYHPHKRSSTQNIAEDCSFVEIEWKNDYDLQVQIPESTIVGLRFSDRHRNSPFFALSIYRTLCNRSVLLKRLKLKSAVDIYISALSNLKASGIFHDISIDRLFGNIPQLYQENIFIFVIFWPSPFGYVRVRPCTCPCLTLSHNWLKWPEDISEC